MHKLSKMNGTSQWAFEGAGIVYKIEIQPTEKGRDWVRFSLQSWYENKDSKQSFSCKSFDPAIVDYLRDFADIEQGVSAKVLGRLVKETNTDSDGETKEFWSVLIDWVECMKRRPKVDGEAMKSAQTSAKEKSERASHVNGYSDDEDLLF